MLGKCSICGVENDTIQEVPSTLNKNKKKLYCFNCLAIGLESYDDLVSHCWDFDMFNKTYQQRIILPTLSFNNKTIQQFNEDVMNKRKEKQNG